MADFYLKCRSVSEVMKFYLTQNTVPTSVVGETSLLSDQDSGIFNLAGSFSLEFRSKLVEELGSIVDRNKGTSVILLLGAAGGIVFYVLRRKNRSQDVSKFPQDVGKCKKPRFQKRGSFWSWLFEEEIVEDLSRDSYLLRSHYFGPSPSSTRPGSRLDISTPQYSQVNLSSTECGNFDHDVSLNSFTSQSTPRKFLKAPLLFDIRRSGQTRRSQSIKPGRSGGVQNLSAPPLSSRCNPCPRCVKGTCRIKRHQVCHQNEASSGSSSALSTSPINQFDRKYIKTSTPDMYEGDIHHCNQSQHKGSRRLDGDGSDETEDPSLHLSNELSRYAGTPVSSSERQYRPSHLIFGGGKRGAGVPERERGAPDGKERVSQTPSPQLLLTSDSSSGCPQTTPERFGRDDFSGESDLECHLSAGDSESVTGSMLDLVHDAREIRRLIREVSIDSNASSICLPEDLSHDTFQHIEGINKGLDELIFNCANIDEENIDDKMQMSSSKSSTSGLYQYASAEQNQEFNTSPSDDSMKRDSSMHDFRNLQTTLRKSSKGLWRLTNISGISDGSRQASVLSDSGGSMEWDSPLHAGLTDISSSRRHNRYRTPVLSSNVSECSLDDLASLAGSGLDQWEWDEAAYYIAGCEDDSDERIVIEGDQWLPDIGSTELDLEAELRLRDSSMGPYNSARSSLEPELGRLPPSGRSSVERLGSQRWSGSSRGSSCSYSDEVTLKSASNMKLNTTNAGRISRSRSRDRCSLDSSCEMSSSMYSSVVDSSGISSMNSSMMSSCGSSILVSSINLSPVKEAAQEITSPSRSCAASPNTPYNNMEISIGNIRTTDTVIKVQLPHQNSSNKSSPGEQQTMPNINPSKLKSRASVALFSDQA